MRLNITRKKVENMFKGIGRTNIDVIADEEIMLAKNRVFLKMTLEKNCSLGKHKHQNEIELFYILNGKGIYTDNDEEYEVLKGDVLICYSNEQHAIKNIEAAPLEWIALVVKN